MNFALAEESGPVLYRRRAAGTPIDGATPRATALLDGTAEPSVRRTIGTLLAAGSRADFAVRRIRMDGIDLDAGEIGGLQRCRVLLGRLDVGMVADAAEAARLPERRRNLQALRDFLHSGRLEVRAAGGAAWSPDFSVLHNARGGVALVGAHYFARPDPPDGIALTCVVTDREAVDLAAVRFEELWREGYDVTPIVADALDDLLAESRPPSSPEFPTE